MRPQNRKFGIDIVADDAVIFLPIDLPDAADTFLGNFQDLVGCALGFLDARLPDVGWRAEHANLVKLYDKLMQPRQGL